MATNGLSKSASVRMTPVLAEQGAMGRALEALLDLIGTHGLCLSSYRRWFALYPDCAAQIWIVRYDKRAGKGRWRTRSRNLIRTVAFNGKKKHSVALDNRAEDAILAPLVARFRIPALRTCPDREGRA